MTKRLQILMSWLIIIAVFLFFGALFSSCSKDAGVCEQLNVCPQEAAGNQNYLWNINAAGSDLNAVQGFNFPYMTFDTASIEEALNAWLSTGEAKVSIHSPSRSFKISVCSGLSFESMVLSDNIGGNEQIINFELNCE